VLEKSQTRDDSLPCTVGHILRLCRAYESAMGSVTIRAAWGHAGFEYENLSEGKWGQNPTIF
jgi:hypothetical protein